MKKKKVSNPPLLTKNKRFSPPRMSLVMNSCITHRIASPYARSISPARVHFRYTLCAPLYEICITFCVKKVITFCVGKLLHFALNTLLHFASMLLHFASVLHFAAINCYYILR